MKPISKYQPFHQRRLKSALNLVSGNRPKEQIATNSF